MGKRVRVDTSHTTNERDWREMEKEANQLREQLNKLRMEHSTVKNHKNSNLILFLDNGFDQEPERRVRQVGTRTSNLILEYSGIL